MFARSASWETSPLQGSVAGGLLKEKHLHPSKGGQETEGVCLTEKSAAQITVFFVKLISETC